MTHMGKLAWLDADKKCRCYASWISTCCHAHFARRQQDPDSEPLFEAATAEINRIMDELAASNTDADRHLGIIVVENADSGECELALTWVYTDIEILVPDPLSSLAATR